MKWFEIRMVVGSVLGLCLLLAADVPTARADFVFGEAVNLGPAINSSSAEEGPCLSADGLELYFYRYDDAARADIWIARRATLESEWQPATNIGPPVNLADNASPFLTADGLTLFLDGHRPGTQGGLDLWVTTRASTHDQWATPVNLGATVNSSSAEWCPYLSSDGLELYFSSDRPGGYGNNDLWMTTRATVDGDWGSPVNLGSLLNTDAYEDGPSISPDGLVLFFASSRSGELGGLDLYMTRRATTHAPWGPPMNLGPAVNSVNMDRGPKVSADGSMLYFYSNRPGPYGFADIYQAPILPVVDFDGDGKVDGADLDLLVAHWGTDEPLYDIGPFPWGDGVVDEQDLKVLLEALVTTPDPRASDVPCDVVLSWVAPSLAEGQDVYFGTSFEAVSSADWNNPQDVLVSQGQTETVYAPPVVLDFSQTYYWRVDFVIPGLTPTVFEGPVRQFTTEAYAYPITNVVASSNGISEADAGPENTVDGSGLDEADQHSVAVADMWLAKPPADEALYIQYEFDCVYKLQEMLVWNYNSQFEMVLGFGVKDVTIEYSEDGTDWTLLGDFTLAQATAKVTYTANTVIDLAGVVAEYVRLIPNSGWGTLSSQYGLSEVRFSHIPDVSLARRPQPPLGATGVDLGVTLSWTPGRYAEAHQVYFETDPDAVVDGTAPVQSVTDNRFDPPSLELGTTYFWRVDTVGETGVYEGDVWSFTTNEYLVVADITRPGDVVKGMPNDGVWPGGAWDYGWPALEHPAMAIDNNIDTKFLHFKGDQEPTGIRVTPSVGATVVTGLTLTTANDFAGRDPVTFELSGSNEGIDGPYTLIASGEIVDFAEAVQWPRLTMNATPITFENDVAYTSYQLLFPDIRGPVGDLVNSMQIAAIELLGTIVD